MNEEKQTAKARRIYRAICALIGHNWRVEEYDRRWDYHKMVCIRCAERATHDPYAGIGG